ncbi:ectoine hydroxylase [Marinobacterium nitratireducens]|uniref:Ectoine hydroxylase n=1 Tax=Marinobacterium nitratireducens TaxID=518897 RepID=A0A918DQV8_9GAMM|nr:ectoine hydroxylase [Marinobacterium nitratireducens]GGO77935.1 ectoine hydroxylase [Marinobacterium nitratireducens]
MSSREDLYPSRQLDRPVWLERQDPVVYRDDLEAAPIAPELIAQFERDGYMVLPELFSPEEVAVLRAELNRLRQDEKTLASDEAVREPESGALRSVFEIHKSNALFARVARDARIAEVARFILGGDIYVHQSRMNFKPGFTGKEFYWHSDFETWHVEDGLPRMRTLSCSILLTDNDSNNGPLMLVPGSHRHYVSCVGETPANHYQQSLRKQEFGVPDNNSMSELVSRYGIDTATGPAGSVLFFDCNTMHGSNSNITPAARSNLFFVYNQVENALQDPYCSQAPRPSFIADRGPVTPLDIAPQTYL